MSLDATLSIFRAIGEESRLRIVGLLARGELTVSEITTILGQSQPRVSRHLKILAEAGLVERHREGAWVFYRITAAGNDDPVRRATLKAVREMSTLGDRIVERDAERFEQSRRARAAIAAEYFQQNAREWGRLRKLHLPEADIEDRIQEMVGKEPVEVFIDLGTGTGRMLELFSPCFERGIGYDLSHEMLAIARTNLENANIENAQVRHGDLFALPADNASADLICIHQVLHYLAEPGDAVSEAARLLKPGGRLIISDFAPHDLEFLREDHAHRRLGFSDADVKDWCAASGLTLGASQTLSPATKDKNKLSVKIWLLKAASDVRRLHAKNIA